MCVFICLMLLPHSYERRSLSTYLRHDRKLSIAFFPCSIIPARYITAYSTLVEETALSVIIERIIFEFSLSDY